MTSVSIYTRQSQDMGQSEAQSASTLSSVPYLNKPHYAVTQYADIASIKRVSSTSITQQPTNHNRKPRGLVTTFSRKSRKRMIETLAKVRSDDEKAMKFCTLTYRDQEYFGDKLNPSDFQSHLDMVMTYITREFPHAGIIWRKEFVRRKSGDYVGEVAPHAHLIIVGVRLSDEVLHEKLSTWWATITGSARHQATPRVDVQTAHSRRHAYYYLSKYVAKVDECDISEFFHNQAGQIGRHWGVRGNLDMSEGVTITITDDEMILLKRLIRSWLKSKQKHRFSRIMSKIPRDFGCSVFGLGDMSECDQKLLLKMIAHAKEIVREM